MDKKELMEYVDNQRWLMNSGLFTDSAKNQLFTYGTLIHREVRAIEVDIDPEKKVVSYKAFFDKRMLKKIEKYEKLSKETGFWGLRSFKKFLEKEGDLNFRNILTGFVRDFCGPGWSVSLEVLDFDGYIEGYEDEQDSDRQVGDRETN